MSFLNPGARRRGAPDPAPQRLQDLRPDGPRARRRTNRFATSSPVTATRPSSSRAPTRGGFTAPSRRRSNDASIAIRDDPARGAERHGPPRPAALAAHRAADAEGLDRTQGASTACRSRGPSARIRCRSRRAERTRAPRDARGLDEELSARGALRRTAAVSSSASPRSRRRATGGWARTRTRTAGASPCRSTIPDFTRYAVRVAPAGRRERTSRRDSSAHAPARHLHAEPEQLSPVLPRRDQLEPPRRRLRGRESLPRRAHDPDRRSRLAARARDGGPQRAQLRGLARGLRPHGAPRALRDLRGVRAHRRVDDDAAREVARGVRAAAVARAGPLAQLSAHVDLLAQRPQRLQPPGSGLHGHDHLEEGDRGARLLAAGRQLPARRSPTTACAARTT